MSVSGMEPSTWHDILYNSPEDKSFGLYVIFTLVGFTEMRELYFEVFYNVSITTFPLLRVDAMKMDLLSWVFITFSGRIFAKWFSKNLLWLYAIRICFSWGFESFKACSLIIRDFETFQKVPFKCRVSYNQFH